MSVVTYSYARQNLAKLMDEVQHDRAPIYISRQRGRGAAVLISLETYEAKLKELRDTWAAAAPKGSAKKRKQG